MGQRCSEQIFHGNSQGLESMMLMILPLVVTGHLKKKQENSDQKTQHPSESDLKMKSQALWLP